MFLHFEHQSGASHHSGFSQAVAEGSFAIPTTTTATTKLAA
jgi:hypothetical protein